MTPTCPVWRHHKRWFAWRGARRIALGKSRIESRILCHSWGLNADLIPLHGSLLTVSPKPMTSVCSNSVPICRAEALKLDRKRFRRLRNAAHFYALGEHSNAQNAIKEAKTLKFQAEIAHKQAASQIQKANNQGKDLWELDLHGLHLQEANHALEIRYGLFARWSHNKLPSSSFIPPGPLSLCKDGLSYSVFSTSHSMLQMPYFSFLCTFCYSPTSSACVKQSRPAHFYWMAHMYSKTTHFTVPSLYPSKDWPRLYSTPWDVQTFLFQQSGSTKQIDSDDCLLNLRIMNSSPYTCHITCKLCLFLLCKFAKWLYHWFRAISCNDIHKRAMSLPLPTYWDFIAISQSQDTTMWQANCTC